MKSFVLTNAPDPLTGLAMYSSVSTFNVSFNPWLVPVVSKHDSYWWLVELPMWLTDGFSVTFFGRWWGAVRIHVSHLQLPYMVINMHSNMQGGGGGPNQTLENSEIWKIFKLQ